MDTASPTGQKRGGMGQTCAGIGQKMLGTGQRGAGIGHRFEQDRKRLMDPPA